MEKWPPFCGKSLYSKNFQLPIPPPPSFGLSLSRCQQKWKIGVGHYEKMEKWPPLDGKLSYCKISNYQSLLQSLGLHFSEFQWKWKTGVDNYGKIATISWKVVIQQNFQLPTSPKFGSPLWNGNGKLALAIIKKWKNGCHFAENCCNSIVAFTTY